MAVCFLDPAAGPPRSIEEYGLRMEDTPTPLLGLVANGFPDSVAFLDELQAALTEALPGSSFVRYTKPELSLPFGEVEARDRFGECTAMVMAWGHCGGCTTTSIRDATTFARSGLPVVVLVTEAFLKLADTVSQSLGITGLPLVVLPHPTAGTGRDRLREVAAVSSHEVLGRLRDAASRSLPGDAAETGLGRGSDPIDQVGRHGVVVRVADREPATAPGQGTQVDRVA